jgi:hypothetical protein
MYSTAQRQCGDRNPHDWNSCLVLPCSLQVWEPHDSSSCWSHGVTCPGTATGWVCLFSCQLSSCPRSLVQVGAASYTSLSPQLCCAQDMWFHPVPHEVSCRSVLQGILWPLYLVVSPRPQALLYPEQGLELESCFKCKWITSRVQESQHTGTY